MSEEHLTPTFEERHESNNVALIGLIFSIIGLILFITIFGIFLAIPLLILGLILGIIGLFFKPRGKAIAAIIISLIPGALLYILGFSLWTNVKVPVQEFTEWAETTLTGDTFENIDDQKFGTIANYIIEKRFEGLTSEDMENMYNSSTGSNAIEKGAYLFFGILKDSINESIEAYNNDIDIEALINSQTSGSAVSLSLDIDSEATGNAEIITSDETVCIDIYEPVCGTDGNVYGNSCYLERAGVDLDESATATESGCISE